MKELSFTKARLNEERELSTILKEKCLSVDEVIISYMEAKNKAERALRLLYDDDDKLRVRLREAKAAAREHEIDKQSLVEELSVARAHGEDLRVRLSAVDKEMVEVTSKHEAEMKDMRAALERAKTSAKAREEEVAGGLQQKADDLRKEVNVFDSMCT